MGWFDGITKILTGGGVVGSLVRTVAMGYLLNKVTASANKNNQIGPNAGIDNGVRLQVPPGADQKIPVLYGSAYFGGIITEAKMSNNNQRMTYAITLAETTGTLLSNSSATSYSVSEIYWNDNRVYFKADGVTVDYVIDRMGNKDDSLNNLVKIYVYAGGSASSKQIFPTGYSGTQVNAYSLVPDWTSGYAMSNLIFSIIEVNYSAERNVKGLGDVKFKLSSSMNKPGDVIYDYMTNSVYGANIAVTNINTTTLSNLNTYSATSINYTDETYGNVSLANRYQINGLINTEKDVLKNIEDIASTSGSWLSYNILDGKWGVIINKSGTSVASFDDSNIIGTISVSGTGIKDLYNSVKVEFAHRDIKDATDFVTISIPAGDRNANEPDNTLNITYNYLNEPIQAQLLGFIELKQSRVDLIIKFDTDYSIFNLNAGDIIDVTNDALGFTSKLFRIVSIIEKTTEDNLISEITALEYDSTVYDETNLYRYTRTLSDGFVTVGNIGIPGTPTITKYEQSSRPRIGISSVVPSGTIEGMEFWLSNDTALSESQRSYRLIATRVPTNGNANVRGTFTSGDTVTVEYDNLISGNLVVKSRAYNSTTVGPFSSNSAITSFNPIQVTDAINPDTQALDGVGGLATALGLLQLIGYIDDLFGNNAAQSGGIFERIFDIFKDETGYDIVGNTAGGNLVVSSQLGVADEGNLLTNVVSTINFVGNGVTANISNISDVTVSINSDLGSIASIAGVSESTVTEFLAVTSAVNTPPPGNMYIQHGRSDFMPCIISDDQLIGQANTKCAVYTHTNMWLSTVNADLEITGNTGEGPQGYFMPNPISSGTYEFFIDFVAESLDNVPVMNSKFQWKVSSNAVPTGFSYTMEPQISSTNPYWNEDNLDSGLDDYLGRTRLYYSICNYNDSLGLEGSTWSDWQLITTSKQSYSGIHDGTDFDVTPVNEYAVQASGNVSSINQSCCPIYDKNLPLLQQGRYKTKNYENDSDLSRFCGSTTNANRTSTSPNTYGTVGGRKINRIRYHKFNITLSAGQILAFGLSCFPIKNNTPFMGNTIVGRAPWVYAGTSLAGLNYSHIPSTTVHQFWGYTAGAGKTAQIPQFTPYGKTNKTNQASESFVITSDSGTPANSNQVGSLNSIWPTDFTTTVTGVPISRTTNQNEGTTTSVWAGPAYNSEIGIVGCPLFHIRKI